MKNQKKFIRSLVVLVCIGFALTASIGMAQSGRKVKKPAPLPLPTPEPTQSPAKPLPKPAAVTLVVGMEHFSSYSNTVATRNSWATVLLSLEDRLNDNTLVDVNQVRTSMTRSDAVNRAKSEKEAYVVWIELRDDSRQVSAGNDNQLYVAYWVFSPVTAKLKTSGQTYPQVYRNKGVILNPRTTNIYGDYQLQQAAREAAERILSAFNLHAPDKPILTPL